MTNLVETLLWAWIALVQTVSLVLTLDEVRRKRNEHGSGR